MFKNLWIMLMWNIKYLQLRKEQEILETELDIIVLRLRIKDLSDGTPEA